MSSKTNILLNMKEANCPQPVKFIQKLYGGQDINFIKSLFCVIFATYPMFATYYKLKSRNIYFTAF